LKLAKIIWLHREGKELKNECQTIKPSFNINQWQEQKTKKYIYSLETLDKNWIMKNTYSNVIPTQGLGYRGLDWEHGN
jgi:hypothetical protein